MNRRYWLVTLGCLVGVAGAAPIATAQLPPLPPLPDLPAVPALPVPALPVPPAVPAIPAPPSAPVPVPFPQLPAGPTAPAAPAGPAGPAAPVGQTARPTGSPATGSAVSLAAPAVTASEDAPQVHALASRRVERERRLRRTVRRLERCLPALPDLQTRVLVLRAGVGPRAAMSRAAVARRIDRPQEGVRRIERRGLRRLRAARRGGSCSGAAGVEPDGAGVPSAAPAVEAAELPVAAAAITDSSAEGSTGSGSRDRGGVRGEQRAGNRTPFAAILPGDPSPVEITLPLVIGGLAAAWLLFRSRRRPSAAAE